MSAYDAHTHVHAYTHTCMHPHAHTTHNGLSAVALRIGDGSAIAPPPHSIPRRSPSPQCVQCMYTSVMAARARPGGSAVGMSFKLCTAKS